ncbi:TMEM175 family protein [Micromonospora sp. DT81.3]|uniref:TMEM175 family protein n=1 Tax=Micromonospora sp. DT81.3 TaxID=3416523 RepID=UPI003CF0928E
MIRPRHPSASLSTTRTEAFTDGVFAIASTLLVLDLTTHGMGKVSSDAELWSGLADEWMLFLDFALSFALLCLLWLTHVRQFEHIVRVDSTMIWLNNARLLFIVLVPFSTGMVTEYSDFLAGRLLLPLNFFFAILFSWLQWWWAVRHREQMMPDLSEADAVGYGRGALSALLLAVVVLVLAPWIGSIAFTVFLFDGVLTRALRGKGS